ncbi:transmembrane protein 186 isoform X2 [Trichomycterus rosablanca]|uniref:transmembrane protein 186 isoform X2 n=1 Tax=Trichomycterus rosablanca TaxID=2290929 RepID=UPI002F35068D
MRLHGTFILKPSIKLRFTLVEMLRAARLISVSFSLAAPGSRCPHPLTLRRFLLRPWTSAPGQRSTWPGRSSTPSLASSSDQASQKYTLIYTFPTIRVLRALSRLKLAQTGITLLLLPGVYYFYLQGQASVTLLTYTTSIAAFAAIMLYTLSYYVRRVVGMMYLDSSRTTLKVAHLSFWGHRRDVYVPVSDVMTLGDTGDSRAEVILRLKRYSSPETLYFSTRLGRVLDKQGFHKVFGSL